LYDFDWIYLLGIWKTGDAGRNISKNHLPWRETYHHHLRDFTEKDISGSPFAVREYTVDDSKLSLEELLEIKKMLNEEGIRLMLDFVPNHTAHDHHWIKSNPEYFMEGNEEDLRNHPENYVAIETEGKRKIFAYGRDPYFPGWPDTLQLNYGNPGLQDAMMDQLLKISDWCDGVRVDMAMLILPDVFERTWGIRPESFWPKAIEKVKMKNPDFCFLAEVYWDLEWDLQQMGFDYTYDKRLYDRLLEGNFAPIRDHLKAEMAFQEKLCRFLENHDEERIAGLISDDRHEAAALITYLAPGMRFFHDGQQDGRTIKTSVHLCRRQTESINQNISSFYEDLLSLLNSKTLKSGKWQFIDFINDEHYYGDTSNIIGYRWSGNRNLYYSYVNLSPESSEFTMDLEKKLNNYKIIMNGTDRLTTSPLNTLRITFPAWGYLVLKTSL
jgi:glycosidase